MRLWSLHPAHLDGKGLVALWREGLLAQAVILERTTGYRNHPQLERFRACPKPHTAIVSYLLAVHDQATARGYRFDRSRIERGTDVLLGSDAVSAASVSFNTAHRRNCPDDATIPPIEVTRGQLDYEAQHLRAKLMTRSPGDLSRLDGVPIRAHPLFVVVPGAVAAWERVS